jgi:hypothetical protein
MALTAFVTLVLKTNLGLPILEDYEQTAKRLECEKWKGKIRYQMHGTVKLVHTGPRLH